MKKIEGETPTPHVKGSTKKAPKKSDHLHEYLQPFTMTYVTFPGGRRSKEKWKLRLPAKCVSCGYERRRITNDSLVEVEISLGEYRKLKKELEKK